LWIRLFLTAVRKRRKKQWLRGGERDKAEYLEVPKKK
jgi:hypothetical protein